MVYGGMLALVVAVVFVNGWTDAPNAIACAVSTGALPYRRAAGLAALCNLLGILAMQLVSRSVTDTVLALADFSARPEAAPLALTAALASIVLFAVAAWFFGIPTSESHALIAALSGAALALGGGISAAAWGRVLAGLALSVLLGGGLGRLFAGWFGGWLRARRTQNLARLQILAAGGMAFMHGAQDGQKFLAVFLLVDQMARGGYGGALPQEAPLGVLLLCALTMALGTSVGGGRIVEMVGRRMVRLDRAQGVCADLGGALSLLLGSLLGAPMSTTHTKTTAMMGAAAAGGRARVDRAAVRSILLTWAVTFPACGLLGWSLSRLLLRAAGI